VVERGARHVLLAAEQLKIFERAVLVVLILPPDAIALRNRTVRVFPNASVDELPISIRSASSVVRLIRDLADQVAVWIELHRSDRTKQSFGLAVALALLELRLAHAAAKPARPAQPLVARDLAFNEAVRGAKDSEALAFLCQYGGHVRRAFLHSEHGGFSIDHIPRPFEPRGDLRSWRVRVELSQEPQLAGIPRPIVVTCAV